MDFGRNSGDLSGIVKNLIDFSIFLPKSQYFHWETANNALVYHKTS